MYFVRIRGASVAELQENAGRVDRMAEARVAWDDSWQQEPKPKNKKDGG